MNKTEVKTRIVDRLRTGGNIYKPNGFMHSLMHQVGLADSGSARGANRKLMTQAMLELESEGQVTITRRKDALQGICLSNGTERFVPATAEGRRQSRWATDASGRHLPGTLPNHLVGPLSVRTIDPEILRKSRQNGTTTMPENPPAIEYYYAEQFLDTLNAALAELRRHVDATGLASGLSVKKVLEATGLTPSQSARVMEFLRAMELYKTQMTGFQTSSYQVVLEPIELTADMLERARRLVESAKSPAAKTSDSKPAKVTPSQDPLDQLAQIVESLESQLAAVTTREEELKEALRRSNNKVRTRDNRIARLQEQLREAKAAQPAPQELLSERAAAVLGRYVK